MSKIRQMVGGRRPACASRVADAPFIQNNNPMGAVAHILPDAACREYENIQIWAKNSFLGILPLFFFREM